MVSLPLRFYHGGMNARRMVLAGAVALLAWQPARAAEPVVVELFTSQSCYSCPPAEKLLGELADRPSVIALEYHVDYWNDLTYGAAGRWRDPFSARAYTDRQREYNLAIRQRREVYTPQMVVDGRSETVGSGRAEIEKLLKTALNNRPGRIKIGFRQEPAGSLTISIDGPVAPADVWLVRFDRQHVTEVRAGENNGKKLINRNVVREMFRLGSWNSQTQEFAAAAVPDASQGCAVLVQPVPLGPILAAAACPEP